MTRLPQRHQTLRQHGQLGGRPPSREASGGATAAQVRYLSRIDQCLGRGTGDLSPARAPLTQLNPQGGGTRREQEADSLIAGVEGRPLVFRVMMRQAQAQAQEAAEVCGAAEKRFAALQGHCWVREEQAPPASTVRPPLRRLTEHSLQQQGLQ